MRFPVGVTLAQDHDFSATPLQRGVHGIGEPRAHTLAIYESVHDDLDDVLFAFVQPDGLGPAKFDDLAIDPHADKALALELFEDIPELAHFALHDRRENDDATLRRIGEHLI